MIHSRMTNKIQIDQSALNNKLNYTQNMQDVQQSYQQQQIPSFQQYQPQNPSFSLQNQQQAQFNIGSENLQQNQFGNATSYNPYQFSMNQNTGLSVNSYNPNQQHQQMIDKIQIQQRNPFIPTQMKTFTNQQLTSDQLKTENSQNTYVVKFFGYPQSYNVAQIMQLYTEKCNLSKLELIEINDQYSIFSVNTIDDLNNLITMTPFWYSDPYNGQIKGLCGCCKPEVYFEGIEEKTGQFQIKKEYGITYLAALSIISIILKFIFSIGKTSSFMKWIYFFTFNLFVCGIVNFIVKYSFE